MTQGQYVALAYGAVFVFVLAYVVIIAAKLTRLQRQTAELLDRVGKRSQPESADAVSTEAVGQA